jgi:hypothetical protein
MSLTEFWGNPSSMVQASNDTCAAEAAGQSAMATHSHGTKGLARIGLRTGTVPHHARRK